MPEAVDTPEHAGDARVGSSNSRSGATCGPSKPLASIAVSVADAMAEAIENGRISYDQGERLAGSILLRMVAA